MNRGYRAHLSGSFRFAAGRNKYLRLVRAAGILASGDGLVVSGVSRQGCALAAMAALFGKPVIYIMHGSAKRESKWRRNGPLQRQEAFLLKQADLLLPVSKKFRDWVCGTYPRYAAKTGYLYPGMETMPAFSGEKIPGAIAAAGGDGGIKANDPVARAVEALGGGAKLTVFGPVSKDHSGSGVTYTGRLPRQEFLAALGEAELFVLNSRFESFSLANLEALGLGCSVLVSEEAGVSELLNLEEEDIIHDPLDVEELKRKISHLLAHPNHGRLAAALDREALSWEKAAARLEQLCLEMTGKEEL